jgi:hypothetical protein
MLSLVSALFINSEIPWRRQMISGGDAQHMIVASDIQLPFYAEWSRVWGGSSSDMGFGVSVSSDGVYLGGDSYSFGAGGGDAFVAKYTAGGILLWNKTWGGSEWDSGRAVAASLDGVFLSGLTMTMGNANAFLVKYATNGTFLWSTTWGGVGWDFAQGLAVASDGVYMVGESNGAFLVKYASNGTWLWERTWHSGTSVYAKDVAVASDGVYITGGRYNYSEGENQAVLVKYDFSGNQLWNCTWGGAGDDFGDSVAVGTDGVYMAGRGAVGTTFLTKYNVAGTLLWNRTFVDFGEVDLAIENDTIYLVGSISSNGRDGIAVALDLSGNPLWNCTCGGTGWDEGQGVAVSPGGIFLAGSTRPAGAPAPAGNDASLIHLVPNISPMITSPLDVAYTAGSTGNTIFWNASDTNTGAPRYVITRNGTEIANGNWSTNVLIGLVIDGLLAGSYNYTIIITDGYGGSVKDTVIVTVTAPPSPLPDLPTMVISVIVIVGGAVGTIGVVKHVRRKHTTVKRD